MKEHFIVRYRREEQVVHHESSSGESKEGVENGHDALCTFPCLRRILRKESIEEGEKEATDKTQKSEETEEEGRFASVFHHLDIEDRPKGASEERSDNAVEKGVAHVDRLLVVRSHPSDVGIVFWVSRHLSHGEDNDSGDEDPWRFRYGQKRKTQRAEDDPGRHDRKGSHVLDDSADKNLQENDGGGVDHCHMFGAKVEFPSEPQALKKAVDETVNWLLVHKVTEEPENGTEVLKVEDPEKE